MSKLSYHPPPAAGLNHHLFEDYSPPPYYPSNQEPPPYFCHHNDPLAPVAEDPVCYPHPGSRQPILPENEDVFYSDYSLPLSMGSASSMMSDTRFCKHEKISSGMKQKIKNSFDKLKPFTWGSNDKLDLAFSKKFKKNSTKPNMRRYSDSIAPASIDSAHSVLSKRPESTSSYSEVLIRKINVNDTPAMPPRRPLKKNIVRSYFAVGKQSSAQKNQQQTEEYLSINIGDDSYVVNRSKQATEGRSNEQNAYVPMPAAPYQRITTVAANNQYTNSHVGPHEMSSYNTDVQNRPKCTWNLLKMSAQQPTPPKPATYVRQSNEVLSGPPKITPVSGQLLANENMKGAIIRPTAFKPASSPHTEYYKWSEEAQRNNFTEPICEGRSSVRSSIGSHTEGRSSTVSLSRNEFYSGSEGYESARVSSSTVPEHHSDQESSNAKPLSDDVILKALESKVHNRENELLELRQALGNNEKALHRVSSDRLMMESEQINTKRSELLQSQSSVELQFDLQNKCQMLLQEKRKLQKMNADLEEQISSVLCETSSAMNENTNTATLMEERLEDMKWEMQQKCGEISLLKGQLRESNSELERRNIDLVSQRSKSKQLQNLCDQQEQNIKQLNDKLKECERLKQAALDDLSEANVKLTEVKNQRRTSSGSSLPDADQNHNEITRDQKLINRNLILQAEVEKLKKKCSEMSKSNEDSKRLFDTEKKRWTDEKNKVLRYQQKLQTSYMNMKKRCESLEVQMNEILQKLPAQNNHNDNGELSFPTEI